MAELDTNFVDAVLSANMNGKKRVRLTQIAENEYIVEDITEYEKVGSEYGQKEINTLNETVNGKVNKVEVIDDLDTVKAVTEDNVPVGCKAVTKFANDVNQSLTYELPLAGGVTDFRRLCQLHANKVYRTIKNRTVCFQERCRLLSLATVLRKYPS